MKPGIILLAASLFMSLLVACNDEPQLQTPLPEPEHDMTGFAKGADVSWLTEMEKSGAKFYNTNGKEMECMHLLRDLGMNSIRLRVWADPGKQNKPAAWTCLSFNELKTAVAEHTTEVLSLMKENGITPEWVQIGNETGNGMLWDDGKASENMAQYAALNNAGYNAAKAVFPDIKVIVHLQNGNNNSLFRWLFDGLKNNGGKWDVIGMSLYPATTNWQQMTADCISNMNDMISRYGKEVMVCETGMPWDEADAAKLFLTDLIAKSKGISNNQCLGVFYWEPEAYNNWNGYTQGAFDNSGKPTVALDAFAE